MIIKICGIKDKNTLLCCEKNNVNFFGMIFYPGSPRNISIEKPFSIFRFSIMFEELEFAFKENEINTNRCKKNL